MGGWLEAVIKNTIYNRHESTATHKNIPSKLIKILINLPEVLNPGSSYTMKVHWLIPAQLLSINVVLK